MKPKIAIVGLGVIGGSIGLALKEAGVDFQIVGHDREALVARRARERGAVDKTEWNLISAVAEAGLVFLAIPVLAVKETLQAIAPYLQPEVIVTDTTTTKEMVLAWADELLPPTAHFVGGDPIVEEARTGIEAARADLFHGATYCLIPSPRAHPKALEFMDNLVRVLGAKPFFLEAGEHDGQMAMAEHLPYILAAALFRLASRAPSWRDITKLISHNFERVTCFPTSEPHTYRDICLTNAANLSRSIELFVERLEEVKAFLMEGNAQGLEEFFSDPTSARRGWLEAKGVDMAVAGEALEQVKALGGVGSFLGLSPRRLKKSKS